MDDDLRRAADAVATTGKPAAIASRIVSEMPSLIEQLANTSSAGSSARTSGRWPVKVTLRPRPSAGGLRDQRIARRAVADHHQVRRRLHMAKPVERRQQRFEVLDRIEACRSPDHESRPKAGRGGTGGATQLRRRFGAGIDAVLNHRDAACGQALSQHVLAQVIGYGEDRRSSRPRTGLTSRRFSEARASESRPCSVNTRPTPVNRRRAVPYTNGVY